MIRRKVILRALPALAVLALLMPLAACSTPYVAPPDPVLASDARDGEADTAGRTGDSGEPTERDPPSPPCLTWGSPEQTGTVADSDLNEISGLAVSRLNEGVLWVMEDHAAPNQVTALDAMGNRLGTVTLDGVSNNDWEDLAVGNCGESTCVFVGEIGDNNHDRPWHGVYRFEEPVVPAEGGLDLTVTAELFEYTYPDGAYDAESMAVTPEGLPVIFTKEYDTDQSTAYSFPYLDSSAPVVLERRGRFYTGSGSEGGAAAATGADLWPDGSRLILRTYGHVWEYTLSDDGLDDLEDAARLDLPAPSEPQGESVAYDSVERRYLTISEDVNPPVWATSCED
ncbi:MAG: hypothetical protein FJ090_12175 [Deltaproteobacteria bacterium]|nr:hypothetical protein [Deltaproteobacteria bacterium]